MDVTRIAAIANKIIHDEGTKREVLDLKLDIERKTKKLKSNNDSGLSGSSKEKKMKEIQGPIGRLKELTGDRKTTRKYQEVLNSAIDSDVDLPYTLANP